MLSSHFEGSQCLAACLGAGVRFSLSSLLTWHLPSTAPSLTHLLHRHREKGAICVSDDKPAYAKHGLTEVNAVKVLFSLSWSPSVRKLLY